jgi:CRP-like cAMP-binding protein
MYVIVEGLVRVHMGDHTIVELTEGELVGELAALDP